MGRSDVTVSATRETTARRGPPRSGGRGVRRSAVAGDHLRPRERGHRGLREWRRRQRRGTPRGESGPGRTPFAGKMQDRPDQRDSSRWPRESSGVGPASAYLSASLGTQIFPQAAQADGRAESPPASQRPTPGPPSGREEAGFSEGFRFQPPPPAIRTSVLLSLGVLVVLSFVDPPSPQSPLGVRVLLRIPGPRLFRRLGPFFPCPHLPRPVLRQTGSQCHVGATFPPSNRSD